MEPISTSWLKWFTVRGAGPFFSTRKPLSWREGIEILYTLPRKAQSAIICINGEQRGYVLSVQTWKRLY